MYAGMEYFHGILVGIGIKNYCEQFIYDNFQIWSFK